jgi:hypothetical protein
LKVTIEKPQAPKKSATRIALEGFLARRGYSAAPDCLKDAGAPGKGNLRLLLEDFVSSGARTAAA